MSSNSLRRQLAHGGVLALTVRVSSAIASYLMYVVLARILGPESFGLYGFAFSIATFGAIVAGLGLPVLVLKYIPIYQHERSMLLRDGLVRDGRLVTLCAGIICALVIAGTNRLWPFFGTSSGTAGSGYVFWTLALMIGIALANYHANVLRGFSKILAAMAPYDVLWRIGVIIAFLWLSKAGIGMTAADALEISVLVLFGALAIQTFADPSIHPKQYVRFGLRTNWRLWKRESTGLWGVAVTQAAGTNLSVVVLGLVLAPEQTGPFFAALKTSSLLALPLVAGNLVAAPYISRYYEAGDISNVQLITNSIVVGLTVPVVIGFSTIVLFGDVVLSLFGDGFAVASPALVLMSFGTLINALCGPTAVVLNMTGHQRENFTIMLVTQLVSLAILPIATLLFGMLGAAATVAMGMASWNIWIWWWSKKNLSIDPTILAILGKFVRAIRKPSPDDVRR